ncbi:Yip1 family protein [Marinobacterium sp. YM272]|uniref:Yip1 family protein n=1 Tax=Marinobacterium sp. YM272 TaxID=3421654 RepID=UPI003D7F76D8
MINHVWGLMTHPEKEWKRMSSERESVPHFYLHHVLLMALVPVVSSYIGTTQTGWDFGGSHTIKLDTGSAVILGLVFYLLILAAVAVMGRVLHSLAKRLVHKPCRTRCTVFAGYIATPMFLAGLVSLYPIVWVCVLAGAIGLCYTAYLLYRGIPTFLGIPEKEGFIISTSTLAIGGLVLEALLIAVVLLWSYGPSLV